MDVAHSLGPQKSSRSDPGFWEEMPAGWCLGILEGTVKADSEGERYAPDFWELFRSATL